MYGKQKLGVSSKKGKEKKKTWSKRHNVKGTREKPEADGNILPCQAHMKLSSSSLSSSCEQGTTDCRRANMTGAG